MSYRTRRQQMFLMFQGKWWQAELLYGLYPSLRDVPLQHKF